MEKAIYLTSTFFVFILDDDGHMQDANEVNVELEKEDDNMSLLSLIVTLPRSTITSQVATRTQAPIALTVTVASTVRHWPTAAS